MQFADPVDQTLFQEGGDIVGPYNFAAPLNMLGSTITMTQENARLQDAADPTNHVRFTPNYVEVSKGLNVLGPLNAPNLANQAVYPVDIACNSIVNGGHIQTTGLSASLEVDADHLIAQSQVTTAKVVCSGDVESSTVTAPSVTAAVSVKTPKWTGELAGQPAYDVMEYKQGEVVFGGGQLDGNDMPEMKMNHNELHVSHGGAIKVAPTQTSITQGTTEEIFFYNGKQVTYDKFGHGMFVEPAPDATWDQPYLVSFLQGAIDSIGSGPAHHRRLAQDYHFKKSDGTMTSFKCAPDGAEQLHLPATELDLLNPDALVNKSGAALMTALHSMRNPRTKIQGTEAQFGLHQQITQDADAVPVHLLLTQQSQSDPSFLQTQVDRQVFNCTNKNSGVGFELAFKGYASGVLTDQGTRFAVSGQDAVGKVYLGKWDQGLPQDAAAENAFSHVNVQGSVRFSDSPTNWTSGDVMAEISPSGFKCDNIRPVGAKLDFHGDVDFTNATVSGLPGGGPGGMANIQDTASGVKVTGFTETSGVGHDEMGSSTIYNSNSLWHRVSGTVPMMYHQTDTYNGSPVVTGDNQCHVNNMWQLGINNAGHGHNGTLAYIQPLKVTGQNETQAGWLGDDYLATFEEQVNSQTAYTRAGVLHDGFLHCAGITGHNGIDSLRDTAVKYETYAAKSRWRVTSEDADVMTMSDSLVDLYVPIAYPKKGSSAHFTHCHTMEPVDQSINWSEYVGRAIASSGQYCVRDDFGIKHTDVSNPVSGQHAMCSAIVATDDVLGILCTVETVSNSNINHEHGGAIIKSPVAEADGFQVLRVAASGDVMCWMAQPDLADCPLPELSGTYTKSIAGVVVGTVYGVATDGILLMDGFSGEVVGRTHTFGDGENNQVTLTENELTISFDATQVSQLSNAIMSGAYKKYINGVEQAEEVIMHVNPDLSFTWSEHIPSVATRLNALETAFVELTGP